MKGREGPLLSWERGGNLHVVVRVLHREGEGSIVPGRSNNARKVLAKERIGE